MNVVKMCRYGMLAESIVDPKLAVQRSGLADRGHGCFALLKAASALERQVQSMLLSGFGDGFESSFDFFDCHPCLAWWLGVARHSPPLCLNGRG